MLRQVLLSIYYTFCTSFRISYTKSSFSTNLIIKVYFSSFCLPSIAKHRRNEFLNRSIFSYHINFAFGCHKIFHTFLCHVNMSLSHRQIMRRIFPFVSEICCTEQMLYLPQFTVFSSHSSVMYQFKH